MNCTMVPESKADLEAVTSASGGASLRLDLARRLEVLESPEYQASEAYVQDARFWRSAIAWAAAGVCLVIVSAILWFTV